MLRLIFAAALLCAAVTPVRADPLALVDHAALNAGVPADIARAVIGKESNFNPNLRGAAGEWALGRSNAKPRAKSGSPDPARSSRSRKPTCAMRWRICASRSIAVASRALASRYISAVSTAGGDARPMAAT
jgi:hypothetical protein